MSKEKYNILVIDEGRLTAVIKEVGYGVAIANGFVTHNIFKGPLEEYVNDEGWEVEEEQKRRRMAESGEIFQRTIPGKGSFVFRPMEPRAISLDTYIKGSEETLAGGDVREVARKHGFDLNPFIDEPEVIEGLKEVRRLRNAKTSDIPITHINPPDIKGRG